MASVVLNDVLIHNESILKLLWELHLRGQMPDLLPLATVIRETNRALRQGGLV